MERIRLFFITNRQFPLLFTLTLIFIISHQPGDSLPESAFILSDKIWHILEYGFLAATFLYWHNPAGKLNTTKTAIITIMFCVFYAATDEYHQSFIPLREATLSDVTADGIGATLVAIIWKLRS